ncbi:unnamed protein product, partial [Anisakis simplex]|uniref:ZP domain-containing protein n=1 Tax=Anisakis simplex TaxID=6269 RepID=A0A0M3JVG5_ANISI
RQGWTQNSGGPGSISRSGEQPGTDRQGGWVQGSGTVSISRSGEQPGADRQGWAQSSGGPGSISRSGEQPRVDKRPGWVQSSSTGSISTSGGQPGADRHGWVQSSGSSGSISRSDVQPGADRQGWVQGSSPGLILRIDEQAGTDKQGWLENSGGPSLILRYGEQPRVFRQGRRLPPSMTGVDEGGASASASADGFPINITTSGEFDRTGDSAGSSEAALNIDIGQLEREINADARESRRIVFKGSGLPADQHSDWTSTSSFGTPSWTTTSWTSRSTSTSSSTTPQMTTTSPPTTTSTTTTSTTIPPRTTTIPLLTTTSTSTSTTTPTTTLAITTTTTPFMIVCPNGTRTTPKQFMPMDSVSIKGNGKQNRRDRGVMRKEECESIAQRECLQGYLMADNGTCFTLDTVDGFTRGGEPNIEDSFVSDEVDASFVRNLRKRCDPNKYNHFQYIFKSGPENIMYSFIPVNKSMYAKMGYKGRRSRYSCYYYRRKLCQETCPRSHTFFVKSAKDLENAATAIAEYNRMAPPEIPSLRQFNMGFYFAPNNRSTWEDGSPYHPTVWPSFPGSTRRINAHSCVNFNYKTGQFFLICKPYLGSCYVEYDVALCEHRCVSFQIRSHFYSSHFKKPYSIKNTRTKSYQLRITVKNISTYSIYLYLQKIIFRQIAKLDSFTGILSTRICITK